MRRGEEEGKRFSLQTYMHTYINIDANYYTLIHTDKYIDTQTHTQTPRRPHTLLETTEQNSIFVETR